MDPEILWRVAIAVFAVGGFLFSLLFVLWCCLNISSRCSREEEEREQQRG